MSCTLKIERLETQQILSFGSNKAKWPKQDSQNRLRSLWLEKGRRILDKSPQQRLETYGFCSVSSSYYYYSSPSFFLSFFLWHMNLSTADLRNCCTEIHETWWSYRYMFLVGPKVFSFVVKGVKVIF